MGMLLFPHQLLHRVQLAGHAALRGGAGNRAMGVTMAVLCGGVRPVGGGHAAARGHSVGDDQPGLPIWVAFLAAIAAALLVGVSTGSSSYISGRSPSSLRWAWACCSRASASSLPTPTRWPANPGIHEHLQQQVFSDVPVLVLYMAIFVAFFCLLALHQLTAATATPLAATTRWRRYSGIRWWPPSGRPSSSAA